MIRVSKLPGIYVRVLGRRVDTVPPHLKLHLKETGEDVYTLTSSSLVCIKAKNNYDNISLSVSDRFSLNSDLDVDGNLTLGVRENWLK